MSRDLYDSATLKIRAARAVRARWPRILAVLLVGVALSGLLAWAIQRSEAAGIEADFERDAHDRISAFKVSLVHGVDSLMALEALYASTSDVSRAAFRRFTRDHLLEEPGVTMLGWAPMVFASDRAEFERSVQAETDDDPFVAAALGRYGLFEVLDQRPVAVGSRPDYFPVLYAEPPSLGIHVLGLDMGSEALQRDAMRRARDSGEMSATERAEMGKSSDKGWATIIFRPVFDQVESGGDSGDADSGRVLRGFVYGMFWVSEILDRALEGLDPRGVDVAVHDLSSSREESLFYHHSSRLRPDGEPWTVDEALGRDSLSEWEKIRVGDRSWLISTRPADGYVSSRQTSAALLSLIGGLLLTGLTAGSFLAILAREVETERYARDLLAAKVQLEAEAVEREQARVDLATSEERFRRVFDGAPVGIGTANLEGQFLEVNPVMCTMMRGKEDELIGRSISEFVHPDDVKEEQRQLERLVRNEAETVHYSQRMVRRDGTEMWAELNVSLLRDADGTPLYFVGQVQDITARREVDERLRRAWTTQEKVLDTIPINIFLKDADGVLRFINAAGLEFLGLPRSEVVGKTDFDLFPADVAERLWAIDRQVLATGEPVSGEEKVMVGGQSRSLLFGKTPIEIEGRDGVHVVGFSIDTTPIEEAEAALRRSEHRFRQLVENMSSGVAVYEAVDGGRDFVFVDYNRAAEEMGGHTREAVLGKRLTDVFPGVDEMGILDLLANVWRTGEPQKLEARLYRDSRHEGWRENYAYKLPTGEVVAIYDDAGERKRLEAELLHAQKMEAIGRLAGGVAHDFNNLLQVVSGNTDLLLAGAVDEKLHGTMLREIHEQAERGTQLARRLLTFSRRESLAPAAIDLGDVIRGAETLVRRLLKENIDLVIEPAAEPLPILGDSGQLEQVLMNLVVNASDAMPEGGSLRIRSGRESDDFVWLTVADTGTGIAEEMLGKVFDPYFTTKSAAQGTGLGLSVVDGIVSRHDGRIEVDSSPRRGVRFKVILPSIVVGTAEVLSPVETLPAEPTAGAGQKVLVVEDQELVRRTIETMLTSLGYIVESAADGVSARTLIQAKQFDIMVSDIVLPDTTGVELAHEIRAKAADFPVLLVSGYAEEAVRERGAEFRFLQKPFRLDDLARQVAAALAERTSADDS